MDFFINLQIDQNRTTVLTLVEHFLKMYIFIPLSSTSAKIWLELSFGMWWLTIDYPIILLVKGILDSWQVLESTDERDNDRITIKHCLSPTVRCIS